MAFLTLWKFNLHPGLHFSQYPFSHDRNAPKYRKALKGEKVINNYLKAKSSDKELNWLSPDKPITFYSQTLGIWSSGHPDLLLVRILLSRFNQISPFPFTDSTLFLGYKSPLTNAVLGIEPNSILSLSFPTARVPK